MNTPLNTNSEEFKEFWNLNYPNTLPISYLFREKYNERWFRIHSLPKSKRYPESNEEWSILLERQNILLSDLIGENNSFILVTSYFTNEGIINDSGPSIADIVLVPLEEINLYAIDPENYDEGQILKAFISKQIWNKNNFDTILRDIADDNLRAFFISMENNFIIAPYDGGVDIILKDPQIRNMYKDKYKEWLSARIDGL